MKKVLYYTFYSLLLIIGISLVGCNNSEVVTQPQDYDKDSDYIVIEFSEPILLSTLESILDSKYASVEYIETVTEMNGQKLTEFSNTIETENLQEIEQVFEKAFNEENGLNSILQSEGFITKERSVRKVRKIEIQGKLEDLKPLFEEAIDSEFSFKKLEALEQGFVSSDELEVRSKVSEWVPNGGSTRTGELDSGQRYVVQTMYWQNENPFNRYSIENSYEHDFFLNNSQGSTLGRGTYFTIFQDLQYRPKIEYGGSNLPNPYLDTQFQDPITEKSYTIGTTRVTEILSNTVYYSYLVLRKGFADEDNAKLSAQVGEPRNCDIIPYGDAWCQFGIGDQRLIPAWDIAVPGITDWGF